MGQWENSQCYAKVRFFWTKGDGFCHNPTIYIYMDELERLREENAELKLSQQILREINEYKQFFLARVAHELRSPLSSLISLQQLIIHGFCESPEEEKEFLNDAHTAAYRLLAMIDDLVTVAKIDYGREPLDLQSLDLGELFSELKTQIALPVGNGNFQLNLISPQAKILVYGDRQKLLWVLRNLIDACLQSTKAGAGEIVLQAQSDAPQVRLELQLPCPPEVWQDAALGIDPPPPGKISPTISLSPALRWQLCHILLNKMNGSITLTPPSPGQTTVAITLPSAIGTPS